MITRKFNLLFYICKSSKLKYMKKLTLGGLAILLLSFTTEPICTVASYYHDKYHNRLSADNSRFSQHKLTAASNHYKLGDSVRVTNIVNGKSVDVKITDRMAKKYKTRIDLSKKAFSRIASLESGIVDVETKKL